MNIERLQHLITVLEAVPPESFDLRNWVHPCGTAACAVGWACHDPKFQSEGLGLDHGIPVLFRGDSEIIDHHSWDAVDTFFGIRPHTAYSLFSYEEYETGAETTAAQVIERIKGAISMYML